MEEEGNIQTYNNLMIWKFLRLRHKSLKDEKSRGRHFSPDNDVLKEKRGCLVCRLFAGAAVIFWKWGLNWPELLFKLEFDSFQTSMPDSGFEQGILCHIYISLTTRQAGGRANEEDYPRLTLRKLSKQFIVSTSTISKYFWQFGAFCKITCPT